MRFLSPPYRALYFKKNHVVNKKDFKYELEKRCHIWWRTQCNLVKSTVKGIYWKYLSTHTGINLLRVSHCAAKSTAPAPHDNGKAAQTIQEAVGSEILFTPITDLVLTMRHFTSHFTLVIPQPSKKN